MTKDPISIEALENAPRYAMDLGEEHMAAVYKMLNRTVADVHELGEYIARTVPPDYRKNVCVLGSQTRSGTTEATIALIPEGPHGLMIFMQTIMQDTPDE